MSEKTKFSVRTQECRNCKFFDVLTDVTTRQQTGVCRRHPPTTFAQAIPMPGKNGVAINWNYSSMWTMVKEGDWCGDHEPRLDS